MNNEYIIVNKSLLVKKIQELKKEREEHEKVDIGMFDAIWAAKTSQAIDLLEEIISLSVPLIPEIEKDSFMDTNKKLEFSEEDMIEFYHFVNNYGESGDFEKSKKELLQLWKKTTT